MSVSLSLHNNGEFERRFREKQDEIAKDTATARTGFTEHMAELVAMQQQEILRLNKIIHDSTVIPECYPVEVALGTVATAQGLVKHVLMAIASDKSLWLMESYTPGGRVEHHRWGRVPNLPQATDEAAAK